MSGRLVLTRRVGESVILTLPDGRECSVYLAKVRQGQARLAFECPDDVAVMRAEIAQPVAQTVREVWP